jgi:sporadic carbohydrate cluster 2OG-Fe(II) oxygenase
MKRFSSLEDEEIGAEYLQYGRVIRERPEARRELDLLRQRVIETCEMWVGSKCHDPEHYLNTIHEQVEPNKLNELRLRVLQDLNRDPIFRICYFRAVESLLNCVVGNELAMQNRINLSIQLPKDSSSLLPLHADVWSGDSPFEVVVWIPLVNCFNTKSMFILPPGNTKEVFKGGVMPKSASSEDLFNSIADKVEWIEIGYGSIMLFNQTLPHGNRINLESETRWSLNCRFKSVFSPYGKKGLGEFFTPITLRPASRVGLEYPGREWQRDA